jgi:hypothetical protein
VILGLAVGLLKLALFVVLPILVLFWLAKALFGIGRKSPSGMGSDF